MATILAGGITYLLYRRMRLISAQRHVIQIVVAANELPPGITLAAKDVALQDWPSDVPTLIGSSSKAEDVVGRPLIRSMGAKEPILQRDLAVQGSGIGLSTKIPTGMRATAVRSNEIVGVAGFLYPGSHVDVLATFTPPGGSAPLTSTVLQNVEVLTAGQTIEPDPQGKPETVSVVTLLLSPEDSQKLLLTSGQGNIQFVLRSGVDQKNVELRPTRIDQLVASEKPPAPSAPTGKRSSKRAPATKPPAVYVLEVIQGTQRSVQKF
jgi:pilus assembly protein CpaB